MMALRHLWYPYGKIGLLLASLWPCCLPLKAEGTAQLMPLSGPSNCIAYVQGNDGKGKEGPTYGRPVYDYIYVNIQDPTQEVIYYGFTRKLPTNKNVYYQILDPTGAIVVQGQVANNSSGGGHIADNGVAAYVGPLQIAGASSGGYNALSLIPAMAGDYAIRFNVNHPTEARPSESKYYIHPFDVTVANHSEPGSPQAIEGRLFSYKWHLNTNSATNKACMEFYTWTPDSLVMMMDMNEIQPWGFTTSFNSHGATRTGNIAADRRSSTTVSDAVPEYRVFLTPPDPLAYPTGTPGEVQYVEINTCGPTGDLCIVVRTTKAGELNVYIDLDGTGAYEEGGRDVYFPFQTDEVGEICIPWDGVDGLGVHIPDSMGGMVFVEFLAGIVHYPVYDPENHTKGFNCALIRPNTGLQPLMYYDNRNTPIGTYNLDGCVSGCNIWSGNRGDNVMVNTWLNTITSADTDVFIVSHLCPPIAYDDSSCTTPYLSIEIPILANDSTRTFPIDPENLILHPPLQGGGQVFYNPDVQLFTYIPDANDSTTLIVEYDLCDFTPEELEGPLCDRARITVHVYNECPNGAVLRQDAFPLSLFTDSQRVALRWPAATGGAGCIFWVERAIADGVFRPIGEVKGWPLPAHSFYFRDLEMHNVTPPVRYRIRRIETSGHNDLSEVASLDWGEIGQPMLTAFPNPATHQLMLNYLSAEPLAVMLIDALGRPKVQLVLPPSHTLRQQQVPLSGCPAGWYLLRYQYQGGQHSLRLRIE